MVSERKNYAKRWSIQHYQAIIQCTRLSFFFLRNENTNHEKKPSCTITSLKRSLIFMSKHFLFKMVEN